MSRRAPVLKALVAGALVLAPAAPALAVQTDQFSLRLASGAPGVSIAQGARTSAALVLGNRSSAPVTISLQRVSASRGSDGVISYGTAAVDLAGHLRLGSSSVTLAPRQSRTVNLEVDASTARQDQWAAVTATTGDGAASGVRSRLAVLIHVTSKPTTAGRAGTPSGTDTAGGAGFPVTPVAVLLLVLAGAGVTYQVRRARLRG